MAFINEYNFDLLVNDGEKIVLEELGRQIESYPETLCRCEECVLDMAALAMNTVRPLYRVSLLGAIYGSRAMEDEVYAAQVKEAVAQAIERVRENPGHD